MSSMIVCTKYATLLRLWLPAFSCQCYQSYLKLISKEFLSVITHNVKVT